MGRYPDLRLGRVFLVAVTVGIAVFVLALACFPGIRSLGGPLGALVGGLGLATGFFTRRPTAPASPGKTVANPPNSSS